MTILAIDVHYPETGSTTAGVAFDAWDAATPTHTYTSTRAVAMEYKPGQFYERELPCILDLLQQHALKPDLIMVDGYVFLDGTTRPGLGKYLFDALGGAIPVVGVAKTAFAGIGEPFQLLRGDSSKPLFITSAGIALDVAKAHVLSMDGKFRLPTLLKLADQLCRQDNKKPASL